jgi:putative peptide zinc metalloprotease protein
MPASPKLRADLVISPQVSGTAPTFVVKDPAAQRFFRFGEVEHFVARQLDGSTSLDVVRQRVEARFDGPLQTDTLDTLVDQLRRCQLLETADARDHHAGHVRGNLLYLRLKAFDPDRLFDRLAPRLRFAFTPAFLASTLALVLLAIGVTVDNWMEISRDVRGLYRFDALLIAWLTVLSVTTAHEFAHGLTCKHFGGRVHEMGFLLIYFQPAFYCNVSDAWLFPHKTSRLWVTFAGAYLEIVVWAVATLIWRIVDIDTHLSFLALVIMTTSGIKTLFNLNPLIKLDGYYLLSDYLEIPNLRQRSVGYLKMLVKQRRRWSATMMQVKDVSIRDRRIYLVYGLLATVYSTWLLGLIALHFASFLVGRYRGAGFVVFIAFLGLVFQHRIKLALSSLRARFLPSSAAPARPKRLALITGLGIFAAALFIVPAELKVSGEFRILPGEHTDVRAHVAGTIEDVYVDEGSVVRPGDVLARLADRDFQADLGQVDAEIRGRTARLKMLRAGPTPQEVHLAQSELQTARTRQQQFERQFAEASQMQASRRSRAVSGMTAAETRLQYDQKDLERARQLFRVGLISRTQLDRSDEQVRLRERELEAARAEVALIVSDRLSQLGGDLAIAKKTVEENDGRLHVLVAGSRPEAIEAAEAEVARLEVRRRQLASDLQLTMVTSGAAGVIATPRLKEKRGAHVAKGDLIAEVHELRRVTPEISMSEKEIGEVQPGQHVTLKARAYPEASFSGIVKAISPSAADSSGPERRVFRVIVTMDQNNDLLRPEMTGNAKIFCGKRSIFQLLTRRITRYVRVESWSWW